MTITSEAIEAFALAFWPVNAVSKMESCRGDIAKALEAALSVPAAAVVGEPVAWMFEGDGWGKEVMLSHKDALERKERLSATWDIKITPLYAPPSAPDGWQPIETAPKDGTEILAYGYARCDGSRYANGQHIAWWDAELGWTGRDPDDRVTLHPSLWQPLPEPPTNALRQGRKEAGE